MTERTKRSAADLLLELLDKVPDAATLEVLLEPQNLLLLLRAQGGTDDAIRRDLSRRAPGELLLEVLAREPDTAALLRLLGNPPARRAGLRAGSPPRPAEPGRGAEGGAPADRADRRRAPGGAERVVPLRPARRAPRARAHPVLPRRLRAARRPPPHGAGARRDRPPRAAARQARGGVSGRPFAHRAVAPPVAPAGGAWCAMPYISTTIGSMRSISAVSRSASVYGAKRSRPALGPAA